MDNSVLNGNFNIEEFAQNMLKEIEGIRAKSNNKPTESRLNTFFRMVGLPMFVFVPDEKGKLVEKIISPGFNSSLSGFKIKNGNFEKLFSKDDADWVNGREEFLLGIDNNIDSEQNISNIQKSIVEAIPISPIVYPTDKGVNRTTSSKRIKSLFPIITDCKEVMPAEFRLAKPFANLQNSKIDSITLRRPFIETVLKIRFIVANGQADGDLNKTLKTLKEQNNNTEFSGALDSFFNVVKTYNVLELFIITKILSSLDQIGKSWSQLLKNQEVLSSKCGEFKVVIKTASAKDNTLGKRVSANVEAVSGTEFAQKQALYNNAIATEEAYMELLSPKGIDNNSSSNSLESLFIDFVSSKYKQLKEQQSSLNQQLSNWSVQAEKMRVNVDCLTGEFIGISLIDIVAVITALFMISKEDLLALVDEDVRSSMKLVPELNSNTEIDTLSSSIMGDTTGAAKKALENLQKQISLIFDLLNIIINTNKDRAKRISGE